MKNKSKKIALICGGSSSERKISLDSGKQVYSVIDRKIYDVTIYDPASNNDIIKLVQNAKEIDFAFILLHGSYGEDGTMQGFLDILGIPYQGSGVLGSANAMNKVVSKRLFKQAGLQVPPYIITNTNDLLSDNYSEYIKNKLGFPVIIKPVSSGSSIGVVFAEQKKDFDKYILNMIGCDQPMMIEAYIDGVELTCGVLGNDKLELLPLVEITRNADLNFFNYKSKYSNGLVEEICPARISNKLTKKAQLCAKIAHEVLFCEGYSRTDMILKKTNFYILETNTIPGMTPKSLYPKSALSIGISFKDLVNRLINLGIKARRKKIPH